MILAILEGYLVIVSAVSGLWAVMNDSWYACLYSTGVSSILYLGECIRISKDKGDD